MRNSEQNIEQYRPIVYRITFTGVDSDLRVKIREDKILRVDLTDSDSDHVLRITFFESSLREYNTLYF